MYVILLQSNNFTLAFGTNEQLLYIETVLGFMFSIMV